MDSGADALVPIVAPKSLFTWQNAGEVFPSKMPGTSGGRSIVTNQQPWKHSARYEKNLDRIIPSGAILRTSATGSTRSKTEEAAKPYAAQKSSLRRCSCSITRILRIGTSDVGTCWPGALCSHHN
jgi:hypothetical protein